MSVADDEALARRLQEEEIQGLPEHVRSPLLQRLNPALANEENRLVHDHIGEHLQQQQAQSPRVLCVYLSYVVMETIATIVILARFFDAPCDKPLRWWIMAYTGRFVFFVPLVVYRFQLARDGEDTSNVEDQMRYVHFATLAVFIMGQIWAYSSETCMASAPYIYYYAVTLIVITYVAYLLPVILLLALCVCLPCVLLVLQLVAEPEGADDAIIDSLPTKTFELEQDPDVPEADRVSCSICMVDYEFGDELRQLPCQHEFHTACADRWLRIKKECPLCRHRVDEPMQEADAADNV